jgi:hypothetical protein
VTALRFMPVRVLLQARSEAPPQTADTRKERLRIAAFTFLTAPLRGG